MNRAWCIARGALSQPCGEEAVFAAKGRWESRARGRAAAMEAMMRAPASDLPSPPTSLDER